MSLREIVMDVVEQRRLKKIVLTLGTVTQMCGIFGYFERQPR